MILIVQTNWANPDHLANTGQNWHWNQVGLSDGSTLPLLRHHLSKLFCSSSHPGRSGEEQGTAWCLLCLAHPEGALTCMWIEQHSEGGRGSHL